ncbi:hypothetical protein CHLRE_03g200787v5 [Chlamydomonas reinhardtii]|uniref:Uncharacterized protein n=1 Tax=Chlamydomonas reinhardtii TaxID=3055 RepID=A0A2K3DZE0_CHLRE|nr:uncharacterized protein CHLRE_03g200787v5 [Chlamydomonas reinhardtii]PNW85898.1 hypothetical protein CHLRE_03g200787v5 [Chlamydomonas reinhardtii]
MADSRSERPGTACLHALLPHQLGSHYPLVGPNGGAVAGASKGSSGLPPPLRVAAVLREREARAYASRGLKQCSAEAHAELQRRLELTHAWL